MIVVWGRGNSTNVKKVLWCLEELELPCKVIPAGGQYGITDSPEYRKMNPNGLVPCLHDDEQNFTLWESNTIVRYLAARYGQNSLWIDAPAERAQAEKWMDWSTASLAPSHRKVVINLVRTSPEQRNQQEIEQGIQECEQLLILLDKALTHQPWFSGQVFGIGDIAIAPCIWNLYNCGVDWQPHPALEQWSQRLAQRPAYRKVVMIPVT